MIKGRNAGIIKTTPQEGVAQTLRAPIAVKKLPEI
jgi:hypothetical protein